MLLQSAVCRVDEKDKEEGEEARFMDKGEDCAVELPWPSMVVLLYWPLAIAMTRTVGLEGEMEGRGRGGEGAEIWSRSPKLEWRLRRAQACSHAER